MKNIPYRRSQSNAADLQNWIRRESGESDEQMERMRRNLRLARERELTARQRQVLELYYDRGLRMTEIGRLLGVDSSTVSRTLRRARDRLFRFLRYGL